MMLRGLAYIHEQTYEPRYSSRYSNSLRVGRSGDRIPVGERFSAPVQTGSEDHPASYTMGTGSLQGVKRPGRDVDHPPPSSEEVKERLQLNLYSLCGPSLPVLGRTLPLLYFYMTKHHEMNLNVFHERAFINSSISQ